jgi:hypothetical protein
MLGLAQEPISGTFDPPSAASIRDTLHRLACSVSPSERQFEQHCRQCAEASGLHYCRVGRQSIRDAASHGISAHLLAALHAVCGVRFGSLVHELVGLNLNDVASLHAAAYPDQTILLPDYLWNPESLFKAPGVLAPDASPGRSASLAALIRTEGRWPLGCLNSGDSALRLFRIGEPSMQPVFHPGDLVLIKPHTRGSARANGKNENHAAIVQVDGRFRACWIQPGRTAVDLPVAYSNGFPPIQIDSVRARCIGPIVALWKNLVSDTLPEPISADPPRRQREPRLEAIEQSGNPLGRMIRAFRIREDVAVKALVQRLERLRTVLPGQVADEIPSVSTLSAIEHEDIHTRKLARLLLLSIAIKTDLRQILRAVGITVCDANKVSVQEKIGRAAPPERTPPRSWKDHPWTAALASNWQGLPWLMAHLFANVDFNSTYYIGERSRFTHPLLSAHSFVTVDRNKSFISSNGYSEAPLNGWPPMFVFEVRATGKVLAAQCRREGNLLHLIPHNEFGGDRQVFDLNREVQVHGRITGVLSWLS